MRYAIFLALSFSAFGQQDSEDNEHWKALYWYAAAHEATLCDSSHAAAAAALNAIEHGPTVWVSKDKHASFLDRPLCTGGCGRDQCDAMKPLPSSKLLPLDPSAPWVHSRQWPLAAKLTPDFNEALMARLDQAQGATIPDNQSRRQIKAIVRVSDTTSSAMMLGPQHVNSALNTADRKTDSALNKAGRLPSSG